MNEIRTPHRPTTWQEYVAAGDRLLTKEGIAKGLAFQPRPTDVIISPYGKSGTTWLQQMVHGLRTRGDMDFDDISRVVPWIETSTDLGLDLDAEQKAEPRAFKSHLSWDAVPKGGRYIVSLRDPKDALVSMCRFMDGWFWEPGAISIETLARERYFDTGDTRDYWHHFRSWWAERDNPDVLLLAFENMKTDPRGTIRRVADFIDFELDAELEEIVARQSSFDFMLEHKDRFDDFLMRTLSERNCGFPSGSDSSKVREGRVGSHRAELTPELAEEMDVIWCAEITGKIGLRDYDEARSALE